jgi:hypothetical protein
MKQKVLLCLLMCLFLGNLAFAQIGIGLPCTQPLVKSAGLSPQVLCSQPRPTPTPAPTPTPTVSVGFLLPKYLVVSVLYAPPGSKSSVTYTDSSVLGTTFSLENTFTSDTSLTASISDKVSMPGYFDLNLTATRSSDYSQVNDSTNTLAITDTETLAHSIPGPASSAVGLDHDEDLIYVWLNPVAALQFNSPTSLTWNGFAFDERDLARNGPDVVPIALKYLVGRAPMPSSLLGSIARAWAPRVLCTPASDPQCGPDGTAPPGLNANDLAAIAKADPFSDPNYVIDLPINAQCTVDSRFCLSGSQQMPYSFAGPGGQPLTTSLQLIHQESNTGAISASASDKESFSLEADASGGFFNSVSLKLTAQTSATLTSKHSNSNVSTTTRTANVSITGPASTDNYNGPIEFNVFQDSLYGSFMFGPVLEPTFRVVASPSLSVVQGSCISSLVSISPLVSNLTPTVNLSATGLPANATATFSPTTVSGAGSSTMTVCATTSTPVGSSTLSVTGIQGQEIETQPFTLAVTPQPDFSISVSPASAIEFLGTSNTFTITTSALGGFNGVETLSVAGVPSGATARFVDPSITGSGTTGLVISTTSTTAAGTYTITITGTSGTKSHSAVLNLGLKTSSPPCPHVPCTVAN